MIIEHKHLPYCFGINYNNQKSCCKNCGFAYNCFKVYLDLQKKNGEEQDEKETFKTMCYLWQRDKKRFRSL